MEKIGENITEVLTPLGASLLTGRVPEAIRVARAQGHVKVPLVAQFGKHPVRLISLESAIKYWQIDPRSHELKQLREAALPIRVNGQTFSILHDNSSQCFVTEPLISHDRLWWRWGGGDE